MSVILWVLVSFPAAPEQATGPAIDYSIAGVIGHIMLPLFAPIGFTWAMCVALIPGLAAREVVIAALATVYAVSNSGNEGSAVRELANIVQNQWHLATGLSFLTWYIYAPMCMATISVIRRETGSIKTTFFLVASLTLAAYLAALCVYQLTLQLTG